MPNRTLALALAGLMVAARVEAEEPKWPSAGLEQRAAERGPIRTHLEAALAAPAIEVTARVVDVEDARAAAQGPPSSPPPRSRIHWGVWVVLGLASLFVAFLEWAQGLKNF